MLKKILIGAAFFCIATTVVAQRSELGFGLGTFNYTQVILSEIMTLSIPSLPQQFFFAPILKVVSFRAAITAGKLEA
jgi:hypothetical protein